MVKKVNFIPFKSGPQENHPGIWCDIWHRMQFKSVIVFVQVKYYYEYNKPLLPDKLPFSLLVVGVAQQ